MWWWLIGIGVVLGLGQIGLAWMVFGAGDGDWVDGIEKGDGDSE